MNSFVSLEEIKTQIFPITINYDNYVNILKNTRSQGKFKIEVSYLHYICAIGDITTVTNYLISYLNKHGKMATVLLLNFPLTDNSNIFVSTALTTAALWNDDANLIRLLISYGADLDYIDNAGLFLDEILPNRPYYNPSEILPGMLYSTEIPYYRKKEDFQHTMKELINFIEYNNISNENNENDDWTLPELIINNLEDYDR